MLKHFLNNMKIFQVTYNQNHYCYYKAEDIKLFNEETDLYISYTDCKKEINKIYGFELAQLRKSLINYFKKNI